MRENMTESEMLKRIKLFILGKISNRNQNLKIDNYLFECIENVKYLGVTVLTS